MNLVLPIIFLPMNCFAFVFCFAELVSILLGAFFDRLNTAKYYYFYSIWSLLFNLILIMFILIVDIFLILFVFKLNKNFFSHSFDPLFFITMLCHHFIHILLLTSFQSVPNRTSMYSTNNYCHFIFSFLWINNTWYI